MSAGGETETPVEHHVFVLIAEISRRFDCSLIEAQALIVEMLAGSLRRVDGAAAQDFFAALACEIENTDRRTAHAALRPALTRLMQAERARIDASFGSANVGPRA